LTEQPGLANDAANAAACVIGEEWFGRVVVLGVSGVVDMLTAPALEDAISTALGKTPGALVINLSDVEFLASAGMGVLVAAHDQAAPEVGFAVVADGPVTEAGRNCRHRQSLSDPRGRAGRTRCITRMQGG
jgi:anti-sigma B factor antagonist